MTLDTFPNISSDAKDNVLSWLGGEYDLDTKESIQRMAASNPEELENAFYTHLSFGTGGMRGLMGVGPNRMNIYTVRQTTKGLANYLKTQFPEQQLRVVIGFDSRHNSRLFASEAARVLANSAIEACLFKDLRPTPLVSFACRYLNANAAIMITASHNPPEYNGYKVYWADGGQVLPPHDQGILKEVELVRRRGKIVPVSPEVDPYIRILGHEVDEAYLNSIRPLQLWPDEEKDSISVLYSCLHGTGGTLVPQALRQTKVSQVFFVKEQMVPDGSFPTTRYPNPEDEAALRLGIDCMMANHHDIFMATDPDADRLGVVVTHNGKPHILTGNHTASLLVEYILRQLTSRQAMPKQPVVIKSFVTTPLVRKIASHWGASCIDVLPGFKYIAQKILQYEQVPDGPHFVFGCEESYGYLYGTHARDKDGVICSCLIAEIAWYLKTKNKTLVDALYELWETYGYYDESLATCSFGETKVGRDRMNDCMNSLRATPPVVFADLPCIAFEDMSTGRFYGEPHHRVGKDLPASDALIFTLEDLSQIIIRPSGTEPKIKIYFQLTPQNGSSLPEIIRNTKQKAELLRSFTTKLLHEGRT